MEGERERGGPLLLLYRAREKFSRGRISAPTFTASISAKMNHEREKPE